MRPATFNRESKQWEQSFPYQEYYSVQDASVILDMGTTQIYGCLDRGTIVGYLVDGVKRIRHEDLLAYIERRLEQENPAPAGDPVIQRILPRVKVKESPEAAVVRAISRPQTPMSTGLGSSIETELPAGGLDLDALDLTSEEE